MSTALRNTKMAALRQLADLKSDCGSAVQQPDEDGSIHVSKGRVRQDERT